MKKIYFTLSIFLTIHPSLAEQSMATKPHLRLMYSGVNRCDNQEFVLDNYKSLFKSSFCYSPASFVRTTSGGVITTVMGLNEKGGRYFATNIEEVKCIAHSTRRRRLGGIAEWQPGKSWSKQADGFWHSPYIDPEFDDWSPIIGKTSRSTYNYICQNWANKQKARNENE